MARGPRQGPHSHPVRRAQCAGTRPRPRPCSVFRQLPKTRAPQAGAGPGALEACIPQRHLLSGAAPPPTATPPTSFRRSATFPGPGARLESLRAWSHSLTLLPWGRPMSPGRGRKVPGGWGGNGRGGEGQLGKAQGLRGDKVDVLRERGARDRRGRGEGMDGRVSNINERKRL